MGKDKHKRGRRTRGNFVMIQYPMMDSPAWRDLGGAAVKLLLQLMKLSEGNNGWGHKDERGELFLGERDAARAIGVSRNTASKAFLELVDHGFLRVVRAGHFKVKIRQATVWRLTFQPYPRNHEGPTNEWRNWRPEQNSRAQKLNGTGAKTGHNSDSSAQTGAKTAPVELKNGGNPPNQDGSKTKPHLDIPWGGETSRPGLPAELASAPLCERCGEPFERTKVSKRFCSEACRKAAERQRWNDRQHESQTAAGG